MDDIKDVSKKEYLTRFLDSTLIRTDAFGHNISGDRVYRRAERIAAAVHLITNHIPEGEPARVASRRAAIELLSSILSLRSELRSAESKLLIDAEGQVRKLISLVRLLAVSGRVSIQNADALVAALDELGVALTTSQRSGLSESVLLSKEDFAIGAGYPAEAVSDTLGRRKMQRVKDKSEERRKVSDSSIHMRARAEEIIGVLGSRGQLGIKDIAANLPAYSEKMIQRELKQLVAGGRVKKVGAKRWSTYTLARP
ncbi:hypothetical protein HYW60_01345 [Candidatus Kaiserbacteria bacterium]|nr:hypothetical protein [Candidatus Kaiserbacteria bacterium]